MSTKKLSKTVTHGDRSRKFDKKHSNAEERAATRKFCQQAKLNPEIANDYVINKRKKVYKWFNDNMVPLYRWLDKQVDKSWNEVYSSIHKIYDSRTTVGRHIIYDLLLRAVDRTTNDTETSYSRYAFYVDEEGILRKKKFIKRPKYKIINTSPIAFWLNGRIVSRQYNKLYWCEPTCSYSRDWDVEWKTEWNSGYYYNGLKYFFKHYEPILKNGEIVGYKDVWKEPLALALGKPLPARQGEEFSKEDYDIWNDLPEYYQTVILNCGPSSTKNK